MTSIAEIVTTPEYRHMMNLQSQMKFDAMPLELVLRQENEVRIVHDLEWKSCPYSLVQRSSYPKVYGTLDIVEKYSSEEQKYQVIGYKVGICKHPENEDDSDWEHLGDFTVDQLEQAISLLWDNREKALSGW